jgi:hypothetical protein
MGGNGDHVRPSPNRRGRGRTPEFVGFRTPPIRGGHSGTSTPYGKKASFIDLKDRPFLKPVKFVQAGLLFQDNEDIFKAEIVDIGMERI